MKCFPLFFLLIFSFSISAQNVYKTPSGKKYHLASCRMVENVSSKVLGTTDVSKYRLTACKICKPTYIDNLSKNYTNLNKAVGTSSSVRCNGFTQRGTRCKHVTKLANGYCYQHTKQNSTYQNNNISVSRCGARTKSGKSCRRKVKGGGHCYQH